MPLDLAIDGSGRSGRPFCELQNRRVSSPLSVHSSRVQPGRGRKAERANRTRVVLATVATTTTTTTTTRGRYENLKIDAPIACDAGVFGASLPGLLKFVNMKSCRPVVAAPRSTEGGSVLPLTTRKNLPRRSYEDEFFSPWTTGQEISSSRSRNCDLCRRQYIRAHDSYSTTTGSNKTALD